MNQSFNRPTLQKVQSKEDLPRYYTSCADRSAFIAKSNSSTVLKDKQQYAGTPKASHFKRGSVAVAAANVQTANSNTPKPSNDIQAQSVISQSKFIVYKVFSNIRQQRYAMKVFPFEENKINSAYLNEKRFAKLQHPNIVRIHEAVDIQTMVKHGKTIASSYTLMEYIPHADFGTLHKKIAFSEDEKLVRTYFKQMISAIEYLHKTGIAHMDIKLENLMLGEGYKLKVIDFDFAAQLRDKTIYGKGTKNYRAPELKDMTI